MQCLAIASEGKSHSKQKVKTLKAKKNRMPKRIGRHICIVLITTTNSSSALVAFGGGVRVLRQRMIRLNFIMISLARSGKCAMSSSYHRVGMRRATSATRKSFGVLAQRRNDDEIISYCSLDKFARRCDQWKGVVRLVPGLTDSNAPTTDCYCRRCFVKVLVRDRVCRVVPVEQTHFARGLCTETFRCKEMCRLCVESR